MVGCLNYAYVLFGYPKREGPYDTGDRNAHHDSDKLLYGSFFSKLQGLQTVVA